MMYNGICFKKINEEIKNIDKNIRKQIFKLNQSGIITFTSCEGHNGEKPYFGIISKTLNEIYSILCHVDHLRTWYKLSNRWLDHDEDDNTNKDMLNSLGLNWNNCYYLTFTFDNLNDFNNMVDKLIEWKDNNDKK